MAYLNIKNPYDTNEKDWVQIPDKNIDDYHLEVNVLGDVGGIFTAMKNGKSFDAGILQAKLVEKGFYISHDPSLIPNGITISTAGILIALVDKPVDWQIKQIEQIIAQLVTDSIKEAESTTAFDSQSKVIGQIE